MNKVIVEGKEVVLSDKMDAVVVDTKLDDNHTVFFQRELEAIETQSYDILYPDLEARECFPTFDFGGPGAQFLTFRSYDKVGSASVINGRATDLPKADISGTEHTIGVKSIGTSYDYDIDEIEAAKMAGLPLEARRAEAAKRGYEETINAIAWNGGEGLRGFFSTENAVPQISLAKAIIDYTDPHNSAHPIEVAMMLHALVNSKFAETKKIHKAEFMWMSVELYHYLTSTPMSEQFPNETIMSYFLRTNMYIKSLDQVKALNQLAHTENRLGEDLIVIGQMNVAGRQTCRLREPLPLQFLPVQIHGMTYEIPARGRFAGVEVTYESAFTIATGAIKRA